MTQSPLRFHPWISAPVLAFLMLAGCAPAFYLVDRQTVLEDEAAGEWPDFEKQILGKTEARTPTAFPATAESGRKSRLFNVLNGELVAPPAGAKSAAPAATSALHSGNGVPVATAPSKAKAGN